MFVTLSAHRSPPLSLPLSHRISAGTKTMFSEQCCCFLEQRFVLKANIYLFAAKNSSFISKTNKRCILSSYIVYLQSSKQYSYYWSILTLRIRSV